MRGTPLALHSVDLHFEDRQPNQLALIRVRRNAFVFPRAWVHVKIYATKEFHHFYFSEKLLDSHIQSRKESAQELEREMVEDFSAMYHAIMIELDAFYNQLKDDYDETDFSKSKRRFEPRYGKPRGMSVVGMTIAYKKFKSLANQGLKGFSEGDVRMDQLPERQETLEEAVEKAEEVIHELIRTLSQYYDYEEKKFHERMKHLQGVLDRLGKLAANAKGIPTT